MKQEASKKKSKLWLWLVIGIVALLAVVGVVLALVLGGGSEDEGPKGGRPELYWNVDRKAYTENSETGLSTRQPGEDGTFKVRFAINGELVELVVADKQLINYIDTLDAMGLVLDDSGAVVDVTDPKDIATEVNKNAYVKDSSSEKIIANTSVAMNGMNVTVKLEDITEIYDVTPEAEVPGQIIQVSDLKPMDTLCIYANDMEQVTHIYVTSHPKESKVYWRAKQMYNSTTKETSREPDENGVYTVGFFCEGEYVELKTKDRAIVTKIDGTSRWKCHFGFTFDEEGYIIEQFASALGIGGIMVADCWDVVAIDGDYYTIQRLVTNDGSVWEGTIPAECVIYDASYAAMSEKRQGKQIDSLQMGDRVTVWTDTTGTPILVYVSNRLVDVPACWVPTRKYSSTTKETTREIGPSGYYEVELVPEGGPKQTYYIKDKETMSYLDSITQKCVGIKADANRVIETVYHFEALTGYTCATQGGCVTTVTGSIFSKISIGKPDSTVNLVLAANARVYNVSTYGEMGAETTIQPGDHVYGYRQPTGEILVAFITKREMGADHLYWRLKAEYDSTNKVSTREPDADGWYYIDFAYQGKQVTLKTKDKKIVDTIDALSIGATVLEVSGNVILKVHDATYAYSGQKVASGYRYRYITDAGMYHCVYNSDANKTVEFKMADDCIIYNVSTVFEKFQGERIYSIPYDSMLTVFCDIYGEAKVVYVRQVKVDNMYWKTETLYDSSNKVTKRTPDENGYYWYNLAVNGELKTFKTKDQSIANSMDSYYGAFGLNVKGDEILGFVSSSAVKNVKGNGVNGYCVTAINGRKVTLTYNKPGSSFGKTQTITLSSGAKIYDVTPDSATFGKAIELKVGDTVRTYLSSDGETHNYVYVMARSTRKGGEVGYCEVCKKDVTWNPVMGSTAITAADGHWYVTQDMTQWVQSSFVNTKKDYTVCLDLNGHTLTRSANGRNFRVAEGETLNIMDSVGGGKIVTGGGTSYTGGMFLMSAGGKVNLYGGTLEYVQGEYKNGSGGIAYLSGKETEFNIYSGTVTGGHAYAQTKANAKYGGNFCLAGGATLNMYDGVISGGKAYGVLDATPNEDGKLVYSAVAAYGGNIYMTESSNVNILGGVVKDGEAVRETFTYTEDGEEKSLTNMSYGGNIYKVNTQKLNGLLYIENATISGGKAHRGGNINAYAGSGATAKIEDPNYDPEGPNQGGYVVLDNATIIDGYASQFGGNIMSNCANWTIVDSKILNGSCGATGGNIYSQGGIYAVENTLISGGQAGTDGGNIYLYRNKNDANVFVILDGTVIENGVGNNGGNIYVKSKNYVKLSSGKAVDPKEDDGTGVPMLPVLSIWGGEIKGGQAATGENIYSAGHLDLEGGLVTDGNIYFSGANAAVLNIAGGTVEDEFSVKGTLELAISGAPKLANLTFDKNVKATVGEMTEGASVKVTTTVGSPVFTTAFDKAEAYKDAGYFAGAEEGSVVYVTAESELALEPAPLKTKTIYCNHCQQEVEFIEWTYGSGSYTRESGHFFLVEDETISTNHRIGNSSSDKAADAVDVVIDLNGFNITSSGPVFYVYPYSTLTVQDSVGTSVVSGKGVLRNNAPADGGLFYNEKGNLNIYSGTFTLEDTDKVRNGGVVFGGGTIKIFGGTFNGNTVTGNGSAFYCSGNLELNGGTINGNAYAKKGANVTLSGAPVVEKLQIQTGDLVTLGELTQDASITVEAEGVFTKPNANAKAYVQAGYIKSGTSTPVTVTVLDELAIGEVVIEGLLEYACPHCDGAIAQWIPYDADEAVIKGNNAHYYIPDGGYNQTYGQVSIQGEVTLDFHGQTLMGKGSSDGSVECKRLWRIEGIFNIMDTVGGGKAVAYGLANGGGAMAMTRANPDTGDKAVINLYSGTLTMTEDCQTGSSGGILSLAGGTVMNMYGGEIHGGKATREHAQNIYIGDGTLNMQGGFIDGGIELTASGAVNLSGTAKIGSNNGGLWIAKDQLIGLDAMQTGAEVYVSVDETAFITDALTNADDFLAYIKPAVTGWSVENRGNALIVTDGNEPAEPFDPNKVYEKAAAMDFSGADADGKVTAKCPVCEEEVEWNILPANPNTSSITDLESGHYYLSETVDYTQNKGLYNFTKKQICINLNGQTMVSSARAFYTENTSSVLNMMGEGSVSGAGYMGTESNAGKGYGTFDLTSNANFYGGTYISTGAGPAIGNRKTSSGDALVSIYAGTTVINENSEGCAMHVMGKGSMAINGGTVTGNVIDNASKGITVSGAPVINALDLTNGEKITVGELTTGANITVLANGAFTEDFVNAQAYLDAEYFVSGVADTMIAVQGNALTVAAEDAVGPNDVYEQAVAMDFSAGGTVTALCPACGVEHDWVALPAPTSDKDNPLPAGAYYVAENMEVTKYWYIKSGVTCINLNGKAITNTAERAFYVEGSATTVNFMGDGVVTGTGKYNSANTNYVGSALDICTAVNLYGGTWKSTNDYPVIANRGSKDYSVVSIYEGTQIVRTAEDAQGLNVYISDSGTVKMYGGIISGGTAIEHPALTAGKVGGNVLLRQNLKDLAYTCTFELTGGTVADGVAEVKGGNIAAIGDSDTKPAVVINLCGGEVKGGSVCAVSGNATVTVSGAPVVDWLDMVDTKLLTVGELTEGASIKVVATEGVAFTNEIAANADTYAQYFYGDGENLKAIVKNNALVLAEVCPHCNVEMASIQWQELTIPDDVQLVISESGHYYLAANVESLYKQIAIKGGDVVVDLRGKTINAGSNRGFYVGDENVDTACSLSLIDSVGTGAVTGTYSSAGGVLYVITPTEAKVPNAVTNVLNVYGGTYTNTGSPANGGCINSTRGLVNIYGGTFNGATIDAGKLGGTLCVNGGTTNIYGGTFTAGNADGAGDCIYVADYKTTNDAVLNIYGGNIQGQVLVMNGAEITISGAPVMSNVELDDEVKITLGELTEGADITVNAEGEFAEGANAEAYVTAEYIKAAEGKTITAEGTKLSMSGSILQTLAAFFNILCTALI